MENNIDVMRRVTELAETCLEGIVHIKALLDMGRFEETVYLMEDVVKAFNTIEKSIQTITSWLLSEQLMPLSESLRQSFDLVVNAYEHRDINRASEVMEHNLIPSYKEWQTELDRRLLPYIAS